MSSATPSHAAPAIPQDTIPGGGATPAEKAAFAALAAEERAAAYLNSIRKMLTFFTFLVVLGIIAAVAFGLLEWNAIKALQSSGSSNPFG